LAKVIELGVGDTVDDRNNGGDPMHPQNEALLEGFPSGGECYGLEELR